MRASIYPGRLFAPAILILLSATVAITRWGRFAGKFDYELHEFDDAKVTDLRRHFDAESAGLHKLKLVLDEEDFGGVVVAAGDLKSPFDGILQLFEDFALVGR